MKRRRKPEPIVFKSGERFITVDKTPTLMDDDIALYAAAALRQAGSSVNSMAQVVHGASVISDFAERRGIDLGARIQTGEFLHRSECAALAAEAALASGCDAGTLARLMANGSRYLAWRADERATQLFGSPVAVRRYKQQVADFDLRMRGSVRPGSYRVSIKEGLKEGPMRDLTRFIGDREAALQLWPTPFVASRNRLILKCLCLLGHRGGELLALRVDDVDVVARTYTIRRNQDCRDDPRVDQPLVKGRTRKHPLPKELVQDVRRYVEDRSALPWARSFPFLIVTLQGKPLSRRRLLAIFEQLRRKIPSLGPDFSPHTLRHTWNENFSAYAALAGIPEAAATRARMQRMDWVSPRTIDSYTKQTTRNDADRISLEMQSKLFGHEGRTA